MAENGILDYQGMNQAIYRGATSNIVVDTQSMSIEIGAGNTSHTSNLHFECNHDANVASIKLNSNVTTEFSRSKKLIKYPRVAMTQNDESGTSGYVASAHSEYPDGTNYHAFRVFNNSGPNKAYAAGVGWESANIATFGDNGVWGGTNASGASTDSSANTTMTLDDGNTIYGEWLQIQLPTKIRLEYVNFSPLSLYGGTYDFLGAFRSPRAGYILGSNNGTNWTTLKKWSGIDYDIWVVYEHTFYKFDIDKEVDNYQYFRFVWTETASGSGSSYSRYASCQELEFWGVPEYDPEAYGTDVTIKSKANVPNTNWLEVYHDAKDLADGAVSTTAGAISGLGGTTNNGTAYGNPQISNGAFVLDGTGDYISTPVNADLSNHTASMWIVFDNPSTWEAVYYLGPLSGLSGGNNIAVYVHSNPYYFRVESSSGGSFDFDYDFVPGKWVHMTVLFRGASSLQDCEMYIDDAKLSHNGTSANPTTSYSITGSNNLNIGGRYLTSNGLQYPLEGKIANFRLFNRILTTDEIYQLYAYQKEYFGYGDLSMTLKAGRLGIGTSEPRAALDVRGDIYGGCPVFFRVWKSTDTLQGANPIIWNQITVNKGYGYSTITGKFTAPVSGYYEFIYGGCSGRTDWSAEMHAHKNGGSRIAGASAYAAGGNGHWGRQLMNTIILELKVGETFHLSQPSGNQDMYGGSTYAYNFFSGKYLSN